MTGIDLAVLFLQYDTLKYPGVFDAMKAMVDRIRLCRPTYYLIDNRDEGGGVRRIAEGVYSVGGDNSSWEFSAWQRGVERLKEAGHEPAVYLFITDAFLGPGPSFLADCGTRALLKSFLLASAVGRIDAFGPGGVLLGHEVPDWLCTGCFFLPRRIVEALGGMVTVGEDAMDAFMPREFTGEVFRKDAPMSDRYKEFIIDWMTRRRRHTYTICAATWREFRGKVRAILNEAMLTVRIREAGYRVRRYGSKLYY